MYCTCVHTVSTICVAPCMFPLAFLFSCCFPIHPLSLSVCPAHSVQMLKLQQLRKSCRGNGTSTCILCGYDLVHHRSRSLNSIHVCYECAQVCVGEREREERGHFLFNRTFTQGLKIIGEKAFHLAYAAYLGPLVYPQLALLRELQCTWVHSH